MKQFFFVKINGRYQNIQLEEIQFIEASKNYVRITTADQAYLAHTTLNQIEEQLPPDQFCRIHRSYIVAIGKLEAFDFEHAYLKNKQLPISPAFFEILKTKVTIVALHQNQTGRGITINGNLKAS